MLLIHQMLFTPLSTVLVQDKQFLAWTNPTDAPVHTILALLRDRCVYPRVGVCVSLETLSRKKRRKQR